MTLFLSNDQQEKYIEQLYRYLQGILCQHTQIKCLQFSSSSSTFEFYSCPMKWLDEISLFDYPFHSIVRQTLERFHYKYDGCSMKICIYFFCQFYYYFKRFHEKKIFEYVEEILQQSLEYTKDHLCQSFESVNLEFFQRLCRSQHIYAQCLYEMYLFYPSIPFDHLHHLIRIKSCEEKCHFIPSLLLPYSHHQRSLQGTHRTIFLDGYLLEDYHHLGYRSNVKIKSVSSQSTWMNLIQSILREYQIEMIICTGTIDSRLKEQSNCNYLENISIRILRSFDEQILLHYLTDLDPDVNIISLDYHPYPDDPSLIQINHGCTLLHYIPSELFIDVKQEQFQHCFGRFKQILQTKMFLKGSGEFERELFQYWNRKNDYQCIEEQIAIEGFQQCLQLFYEDLQLKKDLYEMNFIDDYLSKFDAWKCSFELVKILFEIDSIVKILDQEQINSDL